DARGRRRDDDSRRAALEVGRRLVAVGEDAGRLDHDVHPDVAPRQRLGIALGEDLHGRRANGDALTSDLDLVVEDAVRAVVLEEMGVDLRRREVVDRHHLDVGSRLAGGPEEVPPDASETIDADANGHELSVPPGVLPRPYR